MTTNTYHPRVYGKHACASESRPAPSGSSPRMWGARRARAIGIRSSGIIPTYGRALDVRGTRRNARGIIPAYAGSTPDRPRTGSYYGDHPRVCGEHLVPVHGEDGQPGSSPRMRGALRFRFLLFWRVGIIPAYAGSTLSGRSSCVARGDHPRVCGEHVSSKPQRKIPSGSSPRMRGAPRSYR